MRKRSTAVALAVLAAFWLGPPALEAQEGAATKAVVHVMGLNGVPRNAKGVLAVEGGLLKFTRESVRSEVQASAIHEVLTGDDSQRVVRGTLQMLSTFAPYGGGRFLSLFRTKVDLLTVQFRDAEGGLHGVIFSLPDGAATGVKRQLLAAGARSSVSVEEEAAEKEKAEKEKKEKKP